MLKKALANIYVASDNKNKIQLSYNMNDLSKNQNKKTGYIIGSLSLLVLFIVAVIYLQYSHHIKSNTQFVSGASTTVTPGQLNINRSKTLLYGSNVDISQLLPSSPYYVKNSNGEDLIDIAHRLGINALRISSVLKAFPNQVPDALYTKDQWDTVLNKMNNYGIKAMIIAETYSTNRNIYTKEISQDYINQMQNYIINSGVGDNPDVYAIDMKNEPIIDSHNLQMLTQEATMIKQRYPHVLLTVGGWIVDTNTKDSKGNPNYRWNVASDAPLLNNFVDFYSPHIYGFDRPVNNIFPEANGIITSYLNQLGSVANNKPIIIGEFGAANGDSVSDQNYIGSSELQANTYYSVYEALNASNSANIVGSFGYVMISRNQYPDSWAIIKNKGDFIYPGGYVIQAYSLGHSDIPLSLPLPNVPSDIRLTNTDNTKINNAKVGDEVLVALSLDRRNTYTLSATPSGAFDLIQDLSLNQQFGFFGAILKLKIAGPLNISINQTMSCLTGQQCSSIPSIIYSSNLNVN